MEEQPAVLWDNDGVLVDTERLFLRATRSVLADLDIALPDEVFIRDCLTSKRGVWHLAEAAGHHDIAPLRRERDRRYSHLLAQEDIAVPGAAEVVAALADGHRMAVVTSSRRDHFMQIHGRTDLLHFFERCFTQGDYRRSKPDPDPYLTALTELGLRADRTLVVEDSQRGLAAAVAAGLRCIVIPTDLTREQDFRGALAVADDISAIPALIATAFDSG